MGGGRHFQNAVVENRAQPLQEQRIAFVAAPPVGGKNAFFTQCNAAVVEKRLGHQFVDNLHAVKAVHQHHVGIAAQNLDVFRAVRFDNLERVAFEIQAERCAGNLNHLRVDFHGGLAAIGQIMVQPAGERAAAQADLRDVLRQFVRKQQPRHHGAAVRQHQFHRIVHVHGALNGGRAQMQRADVAQLGNIGFGQGVAEKAVAAEGVGHDSVSEVGLADSGSAWKQKPSASSDR